MIHFNQKNPTILLMFFLIISIQGKAQTSFWTDISFNQVKGDFSRNYLQPKQARYLSLNFEDYKAYLKSAPEETTAKLDTYGKIIKLPMPDGSNQKFAIASFSQMEKPLSDKYPDIRTFIGQGLDDPTAQLMLDFTLQGVHAQVLSEKGSFYIDPVFLNETRYYVAYDRKNLEKKDRRPFSCEVPDKDEFKPTKEEKSGPGGPNAVSFVSGATRRTYRLAIAATGEYTQFHGGTVALALAAINTSLARVNGIFNRDVTLRFTLISNNSSIIYTNPLSDPYTNGNPGEMNGQNQTNLDNIIGSSNYDIGHCFGTNSGGLVNGRVCNGGNKAKGTTGSGAPIGDPFDVDYVAHEIGHQCNAAHTWNGTQASCSPGQYVPAAAVEPGSGITIMGYAGICGSDDLAPNSIDHFHNYSQNEIIAFTTTGGGNVCGTTNSTGNNIPTAVVSSPTGKTIPHSTPYQLTGSSTDADGDALTYCWEQNDVGDAGPPTNAGRVNGPLTRSFSPSGTGNIRTVPQMNDLLNGTSTLGNLLGFATRTMNYKFTVRDNRAGGGGTRDASYVFNVTGLSGPFNVTAPAGGGIFGKSQPITVSWNVSNTNLAPVSCANVAILLSTDGGTTFTHTLTASTPNDGSESVNLPNVNTANARIKVQAVGNIFFSVNVGNFQIQDYCGSSSVCSGESGSHFIGRVRLNTLDRTSSCAPSGIETIAPTGNNTTNVIAGQTYSLQVNLGTGVVNNGVAAWIDYNNDGDYDDLGEFIGAQPPTSGLVAFNVTIPGNPAFRGIRRMRVRSGFNTTFTSGQACALVAFGETEDYSITISGYCFSNSICSDLDFGNHQITRVRFHTLDNSTTCSPGGYGNFTSSVPVVNVKAGNTYSFTINTTTAFAQGVAIWIDYNNDQDYDDANEFVFSGAPSVSGVFTGSIRIAGETSYFGNRRMRVRAVFNTTIGSTQSCTAFGFGETEDYLINISGYCWSSSVCQDVDFGNHFINRFQLGTIDNNNSGCSPSGYSSYSQSQFFTQLGLGQTTNGTATISGGFSCGKAIWIDFNDDEDFNDPGEFVTNSGTPGTTPWNFSINIPNNTALLGVHRLRIRSVFNAVPSATQACALFGFGETEDYVVEVALGISLGTINSTQCTGPVSIPFTTIGIFPSPNSFVALLSDRFGNFNPGLTIGTGAVSPIAATIPDTITPGTAYRIRVVSTNPERLATSGNISIFRRVQLTSVVPNSGPVGTVVTVNGANLQGVTQVFFGSAPGVPISISPNGTSLQVPVPVGATSGPIFTLGPCGNQGAFFNVTQGCNLVITGTSQNSPSQPGCADGSVTATISGAVSSGATAVLYSLSVNPHGETPIQTQSFAGASFVTFEGLTDGLYKVTVQEGSCSDFTTNLALDANPCGVSVSVTSVFPPTSGENGTITFLNITPGCFSNAIQLKKEINGSFVLMDNLPVQVTPGTYQFQDLGLGTYRIVIKNVGGPCGDSTQTIIQAEETQVATPVISPASGTYDGPQTVTITSTSPGSEIYYTTSGNIPVLGTVFTKLYTGPFQVLQTTTVRAMAVKEGQANSSVAVSYLTITNPGICAAPVVSPASGSYEGSVTVTMSTTTPEAEIWYTTNGNNPRFDVPNTFTRRYTAPFILYGNTPIKAIAIKAGLVNSPIVSVNYTITNPAIVATPTFSPLPGNFGSAQSITLSSTTADAQIYYTTNGNVPRVDVPNSFTKLYTGPFLLSQSATVRAKAFKAGWLESSTAVGIYTFGGARSAVAAVEPEENLENIAVFPNPSSSGLFHVLLPASEGESVNYTVLAMDGKEIQTGTMTSGQSQTLDLSLFPTGLYQLKIQSERKVKVVRLVKE